MSENTGLFSADTSKEAAAVQREVLRKMGPQGRLRLTFQLCDQLREVTKAGIRHRHPDYTEQQVTQAYLRLICDEELFQQVFPGCEIEP
jgi:predicted adenine nucleotide alpha hydrolase (AANH) superfamily ATPase